jgi:hypothetical protein
MDIRERQHMDMHMERQGEKAFCLGLLCVFIVVLSSFVLLHLVVPGVAPRRPWGQVITRGTPRTWGVADQQAGA